MSEKKLRPWKTLSKQTILDHGKFLRLESRLRNPFGLDLSPLSRSTF